MPFSDRTVTFGGLGRASVLPGAPLVSDPVDLPVASLASLAVSIYLPDPTPVTTFHWDGRQTASIGRGDLAAAGGFVPDATTDARIALTGVLVDAPANGGAVVAFGDSITDVQIPTKSPPVSEMMSPLDSGMMSPPVGKGRAGYPSLSSFWVEGQS